MKRIEIVGVDPARIASQPVYDSPYSIPGTTQSGPTNYEVAESLIDSLTKGASSIISSLNPASTNVYTQTTAATPSWIIPAAIGAGGLILMMVLKK